MSLRKKHSAHPPAPSRGRASAPFGAKLHPPCEGSPGRAVAPGKARSREAFLKYKTKDAVRGPERARSNRAACVQQKFAAALLSCGSLIWSSIINGRVATVLFHGAPFMRPGLRFGRLLFAQTHKNMKLANPQRESADQASDLRRRACVAT